MTQESPNPQDNWSRSQAIDWFSRRLHNDAMELYMGRQTAEAYEHIQSVYVEALRRLAGHDLAVGGWCEWPWCPGPDDRCKPCENGGPVSDGPLISR